MRLIWMRCGRIGRSMELRFKRVDISRTFSLPLFPRKRESINPLKRLDTRFHGYDDICFISESPDVIFRPFAKVMRTPLVNPRS